MTEAAQEELSQPLGVILAALCFTVITANLYHLDEMGLDEIGLDEMGINRQFFVVICTLKLVLCLLTV